MSIEVPDNECEREDCRFVVNTEMSTCMYFQPIYNKNGENINPDRNTTSGEMFCSVCKRKWNYINQRGNYSYQELFPKDLTLSVTTDTIKL